MPLVDSNGKSAVGADRFLTTQWSMVLAAQERTSPEAREALATLCATYWYPLYAYARRQGHDAEQAKDLTQEFFARLLERDYLGGVDRARGKFRSFLLAAFQHFLANERDRANTQKRGGGCTVSSLNLDDAEGRYAAETGRTLAADRLFERRWALTLLDQALARLRQEFQEAGRAEVFDLLKAFLTGESRALSHQQAANTLGTSAGAVKVTVHRMRRRYRELLREEIGRTVNHPDDIDEEIRTLFAALG